MEKIERKGERCQRKGKEMRKVKARKIERKGKDICSSAQSIFNYTVVS